MTSDARLQVVIVTPERSVLDEAAEAAVLPAFDGELGVLPGRAPLISRLGAGELRLTRNGAVSRYFVDGGFAQVTKRADGATLVTVLTPKATPADAIPPAQAAEALAAADALPATTPGERETRYRAQERARGLARVAGKR